jgi:uncharacterized repeat protein (TIGR03803 family)
MTSKIEHRSWLSGCRCRAASGALVIGAVLFSAAPALGAQKAPTYTESVLYTFIGGTDGGFPQGGGLVRDWMGNLYGTASIGGDLAVTTCSPPLAGCGVLFKLDPRGKQTVLHAFTGGADGGFSAFDPTPILDEAGNLYGTTGQGGDLSASACPGYGCGTVFKVDPKGNEDRPL